MEVVQVAQYENDKSDEELVEENDGINGNERVPKKEKLKKCWIKENTFDNAGEAEASIKDKWSKHYTNHTEKGRMVYYRCKKAKLRGSQCTLSIYLLYHAETDKVTIYKTEAEHDHHVDKVRGIDENVKKCIEELFNDGIMKPKEIIRALQARKVKIPTYTQLNNYLVHYKKKKYGSHKISLGELEQWCKNNLNIPTDENEAFVVSYKILYDNEEYEDDEDVEENDGNLFRIFISSIRLLNIISMSSHVCSDATYKLVWQGFPVLIVGTTDLNKAFHPFGLAICSNEKTKDFEFIFNCIQIGLKKINKDLLKPTALICDAADAIKNVFKNVFGNSYNQIMCWAHMKRNVENLISHINDKDIAKEILEDIEMLQLSNSTIIFKLVSTLFMKKWKLHNKQTDQSILDFLNYFDNEWLKSNAGWYEGLQLYVPTSNIVNNWSIERDTSSINVKLFVTEPTISLKLWTLSYQWAKSTKDITCVPNDSSKKYYIPARDLQSITQANLDKYKNKKWTTFNQFKKSFDIWCIELENDSDWKKFKCNCPAFLKNYLCKHVVGMAIRLKYCKPPAAAKTVPIGEKRKRGRPTKAKPALLLQ
ncbi:unnamed protein product [Rotaria magnacalcarata]|uniref:SWIM-type domain-containing protein n=3 Tax=Rotaria magnacalcarata TaxID=392030 RepID=A0A815NDU7_9BILA|nr:unnamed protein product [Rotaria magnacalcarata]CAF4366263.1 unnamed protein product [Rotaria magnacalcarata]